MYTLSPRRQSLSFPRHMPLFFTVLTLLSLTLTALPTSVPQLNIPLSSSPSTTMTTRFDTMPLSFMPNVEQSNNDVKFQAQGMGGSMFFTPDSIVLTLAPQGGEKKLPTMNTKNKPFEPTLQSDSPSEPTIVRLQYEGNTSTSTIEGTNRLVGIVNRYIGSDPVDWKTGIPTYGALTYRQLYQGIDLRFDGASNQLKGTYLLAPGADYAQIRWRYQGAEKPTVEADGSLHIVLPDGRALSEDAPVAWQNRDNSRVPVGVRFNVTTDGSVGFIVGNYDRSQPLVIDPYIFWSTYIGGSRKDMAHDVATDASGNVYIVGYTESPDFSISSPTNDFHECTRNDCTDAFVMKLSADGQSILYTTILGGTSYDEAYHLATDREGNAYVTGITSSNDDPQNPDIGGFPIRNAFQAQPSGDDCQYYSFSPFLPCSDFFVSKLASNKGELIYSSYLGGSRFENSIPDIAVDEQGSAYFTATNYSTDYPQKDGLAFDIDPRCNNPEVYCMFAVITKISIDGSHIVYSSYVGEGYTQAITVDSSGSAYITGATEGRNFQIKKSYKSPKLGSENIFLTKLTPDGKDLVYSTLLGIGSSLAIALDTLNRVYISGSGDIPITRGDPIEGFGYGFIMKLADSGTKPSYVRRLNTYQQVLVVDKKGQAYGLSLAYATTSINRISADGRNITYLNDIDIGGGSRYTTSGQGIALDPKGFLVVAGVIYEPVLKTVNPVQPMPGLSCPDSSDDQNICSDAFVTKINLTDTTRYNLSGYVRDDKGKPISGVTVSASNSKRKILRSITSGDGRFQFTALPSGSYTITTSKTGYTPRESRTLSFPSHASEVVLTMTAIPSYPSPKKVAILVHGWQGLDHSEEGKDGITYSCKQGITGPFNNDPDHKLLPGHDFGGLAEHLVDEGYTIYFAHWTTGWLYTMTAEDAAKNCLAPQVHRVSTNEATKVTLIAHSMGGLVSRAYIENYDIYHHDVAGLITLGTPHAGVDLGRILKNSIASQGTEGWIGKQLFCKGNPGTCQLGSDAMSKFNQAHQPSGYIPYWFVGGASNGFLAQFIVKSEGLNDGVVGIQSANGFNRLEHRIVNPRHNDFGRYITDDAHNKSLGEPYYFAGDSKSWTCVQQFLGLEPQGGCSAYLAQNIAANSQSLQTELRNVNDEMYTKSITATLQSGATQTFPLRLEGDEGQVILNWNRGQVDMNLTTPDGKTITPQNVTTFPGATYGDQRSDEWARSAAYIIPDPQAGEWKATVKSTDVTTTTDVLVYGALQSPITLDVDTPDSLAQGETFTVTAHLLNNGVAIQGASLDATFEIGAQTSTIQMQETTAGVYEAELIAPSDAGQYQLTVRAIGPASTPVTRQYDNLLTVRSSDFQPTGAAVVEALDNDGNNKYDQLHVTLPVAVMRDGTYVAEAILQTQDGQEITRTRDESSWEAGSHDLEMNFDGRAIAGTGKDGPFIVSLHVVGTSPVTLEIDEPNLINTPAYRANQFEPQLAPTINELSPRTVTAGSSDLTLTITGTNFLEDSVVQWNGEGKPTTIISSTMLTAVIPATDLASAGSVDVTVNNPGAGGGTSNILTFSIAPASTDTPTPTSSPSVTPTQSVTPTRTATVNPTFTPTPIPSITATPSSTPVTAATPIVANRQVYLPFIKK